jgi:hypothetical protein
VRARMVIISLATVMSHCNLSISNPLHGCNYSIYLERGGESQDGHISLATVMSHSNLSISNPLQGCNYSIYLEGGGES